MVSRVSPELAQLAKKGMRPALKMPRAPDWHPRARLRRNGWRSRLQLFLDEPQSSRAAHFVWRALMLLIVVSNVVICVQTLDTEDRPFRCSSVRLLKAIEVFTNAIFTLEVCPLFSLDCMSVLVAFPSLSGGCCRLSPARAIATVPNIC